jgi:hypothetical protein
MSLAKVSNLFPIEEEFESVRLFFAKDSLFSNVWHLCDAALGTRQVGNMTFFIALHGHVMPAVIRADSVRALKEKERVSEHFCARCLEEYNLAKPIIEQKRLLKFS